MTVAEEEPFQRVTQVLRHVQAVGDLHGLWRAMPNALGIDTPAIPADDLDTRLRL
jgi:hypothetical protein